MKAVIIYESVNSNTRSVTEAIGAGLAISIDTRCYEVSEAPTGFEDDVVLVVVGAPAHRFGLSSRNSRRGAQRDSSDAISPIGMRDWLGRLDKVAGKMVVAFDTHPAKLKRPGSATRGIIRRMTSAGYEPLTRSERFWVDGANGPMIRGELDRAHRWGKDIGAAVAVDVPGRSSS